jgi:hypothetical protein
LPATPLIDNVFGVNTAKDPAGRGPALVSQGGVLVHHGPQTADIDIAALVDQLPNHRA